MFAEEKKQNIFRNMLTLIDIVKILCLHWLDGDEKVVIKLVWYLRWIGYRQSIHFKWRHWRFPRFPGR